MKMNKQLKWRIFLVFAVIFICCIKIFPLNKALNLGLDLQGGTYLTLQVETAGLSAEEKKDATDRVLEIINTRIDEFGVAEPSIQKSGKDRIIVQIPGIGTDGAKRIKDIIKRQAHLEFRLVIDDEEKLKNALDGKVSPSFYDEYEVLYEEKVDPKTTEKKSIPLLVSKQAYLSGDMLVDARVNFASSQFNELAVGLEFNKKGARRFAKVTEENVHKRLAIVLDKKIQSAPVIQEKISGGQASITGSFNITEAQDLAIALRAGALPAPVNFIQESTIGPSLGADSIRKGVKSGILGLMLIFIFMVIYYSISGMLANVALFLNLIITLAALSYFHATLTLPGIAGIILSIGMAVDANVLIFERMREELALGKEMKAAITAGYNKAFITIFDSNITTLITAIILFKFGTGPIRGFAVTLTIGLIASFFTALFVTRVIYDFMTQVLKIKKIGV